MPDKVLVKPRRLVRTTELGSLPVVIAAPSEACGITAAKTLATALTALGVVSEIVTDPSEHCLSSAKGPVFLIGNLANSQCTKYLYFRFLCATDRWYPGPAGYEVRTLLDPLGTGHNIIHLGYSDDDGLAQGLQALLSHLAVSLPYLRELSITRLHLAAGEAEFIKNTGLPSPAWVVANSALSDQKGFLAYLTGETTLIDEYLDAWEQIIACGIGPSEKIVQTHLFMLARVVSWRLLEQSGFLPEAESTAIAQFIYDWTDSVEGVPEIMSPIYQRPYLPRQNHGMFPALGLVYAADYFRTHYPGLPGPDRWQTAADAVFAPYVNGSWKPICDGLCHGWWLSQPIMLEYGLMDPEHRYFENGGARQAAECAVAVINNQGWMPSAGDADLPRQFPGASLRIAAAYYGDPRYRYILDRVPEERRHKWICMVPPRAFDIGLKGVAPTDQTGVTVIPIDPLLYHVWEREPDLASKAADTPPYASIEQCFDKLTVRSGWELADDYLLIDGLGGGSHSYADAGAILDYARFGVSCIIAEDSLIWTAPEDHSTVTVTRDGVMGKVPAFAALEEKSIDSRGNAYLRIRLANYAGADWVREIHFRSGKCVVFHDTIIANEPGDYAVEAHFRTPARVNVVNNTVVSERTSYLGHVEFRLLGLQTIEATTIPVHLLLEHPKHGSGKHDPAIHWKSRYQTSDASFTDVSSRKAVRLLPGQAVSLTHLAQIRALNEPQLTIEREGNELTIYDGQKSWSLACAYQGTPSDHSTLSSVHDVAEVRPQQHIEFPSDVTCLQLLLHGAVVCGTEGGTIACIDAEGEVVWQRNVEAPIRSIGVAGDTDPIIAVGHGPAQLTAFTATGTQLWERTITWEPSPWSWWELPTPAPVQVAGGLFAGEAGFAVGTGDLQVRFYDAIGQERWMWRYNEGVPGRIRVADVDGDGTPEIVVGGDILSDTSFCRILSHQRKLKADLPVEGWTSCLTALAWAQVGSRYLIACGASRGRNLRLYDVTPIANGGKAVSLLEASIGGRVLGLALDQESQTLLVGTAQGFLIGYNTDGQKLWHRLLPHAITQLVEIGNLYAVSDKNGSVRFTTSAGVDQAVMQLDRPWSCATIASGRLWFGVGPVVGSIRVN